MASQVRNSQIHIRSTDEETVQWNELARKFGYSDLSKFTRALLGALTEKYEADNWTSGLLHLDQGKVCGPVVETPDLLHVYAFPVAAPARFWRYVEAVRKGAVSCEPRAVSLPSAGQPKD